MSIAVKCPGCAKTLKAPPTLAGKAVRCPGCQAAVRIPAPAATATNVQPKAVASAPRAAAQPAKTVARKPAPAAKAATPAAGGFDDLFDDALPKKPAKPTASLPDDDDVDLFKLAPPVDRPGEFSKTLPTQAALAASRPQPELPGRPAEIATTGGGLASGRLYFLFALAFIPLALSVLSTKDDDLIARLQRTLEAKAKAAVGAAATRNPASVPAGTTPVKRDASQEAAAPEDEEFEDFEEGYEEEESDFELAGLLDETTFEQLRAEGIDGAHLPGDTWMHWIYALLSAGLFLAATMLLFDRGDAKVWQVVGVAVFTATFGILFLLMLQWIAMFTQNWWVRGANVITLLFYILKFIGWMYLAAMDPDMGFAMSLLGFTMGIGLCEEVTKALPVMMRCGKNDAPFDWRGASVYGMASGVGFGVAEGILYASDYYNGLSTSGIYFVRFISCVGLHAVWGAAVGIMVLRTPELFEGTEDLGNWVLALFKAIGVPMLLHGLYNTLLKKEMAPYALLIAIISFLWLAWLIERSRATERAPSRRLAMA